MIIMYIFNFLASYADRIGISLGEKFKNVYQQKNK